MQNQLDGSLFGASLQQVARTHVVSYRFMNMYEYGIYNCSYLGIEMQLFKVVVRVFFLRATSGEISECLSHIYRICA